MRIAASAWWPDTPTLTLPQRGRDFFAWRRGRDSNSRWRCRHTAFREPHLKPLGRPSGRGFYPSNRPFPRKRGGRYGSPSSPMARDLGAIAAAAHAAPLALASPGGVLEDPPALRVFADPQPFGVALDQLSGNRLGQPGDGTVYGVALVPVVQRHAVGRRNELIDVVRAQRPVDLIQVAGIGRTPRGGGFQDAAHRPPDAAKPAERLQPTRR